MSTLHFMKKPMRRQWWRLYGYTLQEFADHMEISKERVRQLALKNSSRLAYAAKEMKK